MVANVCSHLERLKSTCSPPGHKKPKNCAAQLFLVSYQTLAAHLRGRLLQASLGPEHERKDEQTSFTLLLSHSCCFGRLRRRVTPLGRRAFISVSNSRLRTMRTALYAVAATCATAAPASMSDAARLRSLGYRASEIAAIRPTVASVVARRGLPRPRFVRGVLFMSSPRHRRVCSMASARCVPVTRCPLAGPSRHRRDVRSTHWFTHAGGGDGAGRVLPVLHLLRLLHGRPSRRAVHVGWQ